MSNPNSLLLEEWLPKQVEFWNNQEGRIKGQYDQQEDLNKRGFPSFAGPYNWMWILVQAHLNSLKALQILSDRHNDLREQFALTLGLDEKASSEEIERVAEEMREIFIEMRRIRGERASKVGNET
jgi:hypothetical protein